MNDSYLPYKLTDELLVELIVSSKDPLLFKVLYERYIFKVFNTCLSFSNNNQEAEDICQDIFLKLLDKIHTFKGASKFSTWLYSFTYNHCVNYFHRNKVKKFEKNTSNIEQICNEVIAQSSDEDLVQMIKLEKLNEALELIPFEDKQILILKYQEFKSVKDLMDLHNAGESAIKMRLKRAKEKLIGVYNVVNCQALI
ncbi:MAG: sigma-70 family RNA polymerase sigma factor [Flavobacteriaceae bacterium]|nr:sigma-70 family RNA polymerase sigma factor [Flavobacteriaceae bacterium]